jgi:hypothetical protein
MSSRALAASITEDLNYHEGSSLRGQIHQHSNPTGIIRDTAIQKVIMNSERDGLLRELDGRGGRVRRASAVLSDFYGAVQETFPKAWEGQTPKTSRLVHSAGIVAMGYVMDALHASGATSRADFREGLAPLARRTAWTAGSWQFSKDEVVPWNGLQNVSRHVIKLAQYLVGCTREGQRRHAKSSVRR